MSVTLGGLRVKPSWILISPSFDRDKIIVKQWDLHKVLSVVFHFIIRFFKCWDHAVWFRFCCWVVIWEVSKLRRMCFSPSVWTNFECSLDFHLVVMIKTMMKLMQLSRPPFYTHVTQERSLSRRRYLHQVELTRSHNKMQFRVHQ